METTQRLLAALADYESERSSFYDEVVEQVAARVSREGSIGKADIGALVLWKRLDANTPWAKDLMERPDEDVRNITSQAYQQANEETAATAEAAGTARSTLTSLPGFKTGDALASAVIYALAPHRMAVYDRRAQAGLEALGLTLTAKPGRYARYMKQVEQLTLECRPIRSTITARDVDLALYRLGGKG